MRTQKDETDTKLRFTCFTALASDVEGTAFCPFSPFKNGQNLWDRFPLSCASKNGEKWLINGHKWWPAGKLSDWAKRRYSQRQMSICSTVPQAPIKAFIAGGDKGGVNAVKREDTNAFEVVLSGETLC